MHWFWDRIKREQMRVQGEDEYMAERRKQKMSENESNRERLKKTDK